MRFAVLGGLLFGLGALAGCGSATDSASFGDGAPRNAGESSAPGGDGLGGSTGTPGTPAPDPSQGGTPGAQQAGQLTAGVWDDNLNWQFFGKYLSDSAALDGLPKYSLAERENARNVFLQRTGSTELDIAFLFDTTGSMGDELSYLQKEVGAIADAIKVRFPQTTPRFGLVVYKDKTDSYISKKYEFAELATFQTSLNAQAAGGGGDYPEAVAEGLAETLGLSWRAGSVARLTFWIADAPHHVGQEVSVKESIDGALKKGIHIYPVAASGTDPRAEYTMRTAAQITGGRYIFLTDDSGIGNSHAEPHIPCYHVTRFDRAIVRMVESEMSGAHVLPPAAEILRSVGSPSPDGKCTLQSKDEVTLY
jgi:hypothetical protein